jgi:hypothetical protein
MSDFSPTTPEGDESREIAEMRWKAVVGFLTHPDLPPLAAKLGVLLISKMNTKTRECYPSERRLAAELNANIKSIKDAKNSLKSHGLLTWDNPFGPRGGSYYSFSFEHLDDVRKAATKRGDKALEDNNATRPLGSKPPIQKGASTPNKEGVRTPKDATTPDSMRVLYDFYGGVEHSPKGCTVPSMRVYAPPELTQLNYSTEVAQLEHAAARGGGQDDADAQKGVEVKSTPRPKPVDEAVIAKRKADAERATRSAGILFTRLFDEFEREVPFLEVIRRMEYGEQEQLSRLLAMRGREAAVSRLSAYVELSA